LIKSDGNASEIIEGPFAISSKFTVFTVKSLNLYIYPLVIYGSSGSKLFNIVNLALSIKAT
jgi:hypothetical protein